MVKKVLESEQKLRKLLVVHKTTSIWGFAVIFLILSLPLSISHADETVKSTEMPQEEISFSDPTSIDEKRAINEKNYQKSVRENQTLNQYLEYGLFTRNTPEIRNLSDFLWETDYIYIDSYKDGSKNFTKTEDPIFDYINKSHWFVYRGINYPFVDRFYYQELWKQIDANTTLSTKYGYCDDKDILFKSLMLQKSIPTQIRVLEKTDGYVYRHSTVLVWWNSTWTKVDPSKYAKVGRWGAGWDKEGVEDITDKAPLDEFYMISAYKW